MLSQEAALLDYVERLRRHTQKRRAVHVRLSKLRPFNRREHHLRAAATAFEPLTAEFEGAFFRLVNTDMVLICKGATVAKIDDSVLYLRYLFSEDPLFKDDNEERTPFCRWFDLEHEYDALLAFARRAVETREARVAGRRTPRPIAENEPTPTRPLRPGDLDSLRLAIDRVDLSSMIRRQPVCAIARGKRPQPVFHEIFTSIEALGRTLLPDVDFHANRWLFQVLTQHLDSRVLAHLARNDDAILHQAISLNLNVGTLVSPEFMNFMDLKAKAGGGPIVIELALFDIFADLGAFLYARKNMRQRGYRFCLDGTNHLSLPLIDRERLGFDFIKLFWSADLHDHLSGAAGDAIRHAVRNIEQGRLILARCDSKRSLEVGRSLGITLYQGHQIDDMLGQHVSRKQIAKNLAKAMFRHRAVAREGGRG